MMNRRSAPSRCMSSDQLQQGTSRKLIPRSTSNAQLLTIAAAHSTTTTILRHGNSSNISDMNHRSDHHRRLPPRTPSGSSGSVLMSERRSLGNSSSRSTLQRQRSVMSSRKLLLLERTTSDASLDVSSHLQQSQRRGGTRKRPPGDRGLLSSSSSNHSFRSLNSSGHTSFSSDISFNDNIDTSFRDDNEKPLRSSPSLYVVRKATIFVTTIWMIALFCIGNMLAQNFAVVVKQQPVTTTTTNVNNSITETVVDTTPNKKNNNKASLLDDTVQRKETVGATVSNLLFDKNVEELEKFQRQQGPGAVRKVITAYTEPTFQDTVPGTGSRGNPHDKTYGTVPTFRIPLPRRTTTPNDLQMHLYPAAQTCHDLPAKFPIDRGLQFDPITRQPMVWNIGGEATPPDFAQTQAEYCPVEMDPFLPWIHDVFPSSDGTRIQFVAQNMRRCRTGKAHTDNVNRLVPQVTLMQAISVERINETYAQELAPDLWMDNSSGTTSSSSSGPRYRLAPHEDASADGMETRFICRFHTSRVLQGELTTVVLGETLSVFPFNYEYVSYRKEKRSLLTPKGKDSAFFWASTLLFDCPVPDFIGLKEAIADGTTILKDGTPTIHVDIVPIRTSARYDEVYLTRDQIGPHRNKEVALFDPRTRWGSDHVLPRLEASGRWANIPICQPPKPTSGTQATSRDSTNDDTKLAIEGATNAVQQAGLNFTFPRSNTKSSKPHFLSACLWASAEFKHRGETEMKNTDTVDRLQEWIEYHLMVGFDHVYVYDNTGAHTNETSLEPILSRYPATMVTRIDWPSTVCSNNRPSAESVGERSSQYAAESSCRVRYGQHTEWMASFDTDEYFVPMGNYTNLKDVLKDAYHRDGTNILSFRSSRGKLRLDKSDYVFNGTATVKSKSSTFLEAYNCDGAGIPKPEWATRAKKQIYRTDYVLHHFVHYSTATRGITKTYKEEGGDKWERRYRERSEMFTDETTQAVMVHTKSINAYMTDKFQKQCRHDTQKAWQECWVAIPWPVVVNTTTTTYDPISGLNYNCYINSKVETYWIPRLKEALAKRKAGGTGAQPERA